MRRKFNTEGQCNPEIHYMVRLDKRVHEIKDQYVDQGSYFVINKGRQYGKTTTLWALEEYLKDDYIVVSMDFQGITTTEYGDEAIFTKAFIRMFIESLEDKASVEETGPLIGVLESTEIGLLSGMFYAMSKLCKMAEKPVVHSVILAGVYDIKNLKLKIRPEPEHQYNSPWNIAAVFDVDMSFSAKQIEIMLNEYEEDKYTGMDVKEVAEQIYQYTSGYPYLVSAICKIMDEKLSYSGTFTEQSNVWTREGILEAVNIILKSNTPLFDSMIKQLDTYENLCDMLQDMLYQGKRIPFSPDEKAINLGVMFGFLKAENGQVVMANRIFEMRLLNMFITRESVKSDAFRHGDCDRNQFIQSKRLDMDLVLKKFEAYYKRYRELLP